MNVCIVTNKFVTGEGQGRVNYEIARQAAEAGHRVTCVAHTVSPDLYVRPRIEWVYMPDEHWPLALPGSLRFGYRATQWLETYGDEFDLIIGNGCNTWYPVDINIVHFVHSAWRASPAHDSEHDPGPYGWYQWIYSSVHAHLEQRFIPQAEVVVAVSRKVKRELVEHGVLPEQIRVIHNGVDLETFSPESESAGSGANESVNGETGVDLPPPDEAPTAVFAGDIQTPRKNLDSVLEALQDVPRLHLVVAGRTEGSPFPDLADRLGVDDRTHFLGFRDDVEAVMRSSDLFVFPSRYEACTLVLLEAMASGLPVITAETAGGAELICDDCGIVLDDPEDERLTTALQQLAERPHLRASMGRQARAQARRLSWSRMADAYLDLMDDLVAASPGSATGSDGRGPSPASS